MFLEDEEIVFNAGPHWQAVKMRYGDDACLDRPCIATFTEHL